MQGIAVLDAGGQYCHLLARRVREAGVQSHVLPIDTNADQLAGIGGIIISGGPRSVTEAGSPRVHPSILSIGVPILGICYGHQLLAATMPGGIVKPSYSREYGLAKLRLQAARGVISGNDLFDGVPDNSQVWVSHGDSVEKLPDCFEVLGATDDCAVAAMVYPTRNIYGVQFHPEVTHSEFGQRILENFVRRVCRSGSNWRPSSADTIDAIKTDIRARVGPTKNVLFFVSGGVDSSVAYKLCADALGEDRVHGVYVDTGFMRKNESAEVMSAYENAGFKNVRLRDASAEFLGAVGRETNPETKRQRIGVAFLAVENDVLEHLPSGEWLLGQGTIYPDTIESGGTRESALIKTHHNRVPELLRRIEAGEIVEPLAQFYKDEVREIGRALGLPVRLIEKQPFPGPGLAVRFLCTDEPAEWSENAKLSEVASAFNVKARVLPVRGVGVQGDERTYAHTALLTGEYDEAGDRRVGARDHELAARRQSRRLLGRRKGIDRRVPRRADHDFPRGARCAARGGRMRARHPRRVRHAETHLAMSGRDAAAQAARGVGDRHPARGVARRHDRAILAPSLDGYRTHSAVRSASARGWCASVRCHEQATGDD